MKRKTQERMVGVTPCYVISTIHGKMIDLKLDQPDGRRQHIPPRIPIIISIPNITMNRNLVLLNLFYVFPFGIMFSTLFVQSPLLLLLSACYFYVFIRQFSNLWCYHP